MNGSLYGRMKVHLDIVNEELVEVNTFGKETLFVKKTFKMGQKLLCLINLA